MEGLPSHRRYGREVFHSGFSREMMVLKPEGKVTDSPYIGERLSPPSIS